MHGGSHVILGSTSIQLVDMEAPEKRRTIADDTQEDENLLDPPLHLAQFGPKGRIVTASVENNIVKLWPSVSQTANHMMYPEHTIYAREDRSGSGYVYRLVYNSLLCKVSAVESIPQCWEECLEK